MFVDIACDRETESGVDCAWAMCGDGDGRTTVGLRKLSTT